MPSRRAPIRTLPIVPEGHLRIGGPLAIPEVLLGLGADPAEVLASIGLDAQIFADPENPVPCTALGRLMSACVARTGCRHFGLLVGERGGPASLGLIGLLMRQAPDVGTAVRQVALYLHLHDRGAVVVLSSQDGVARIAYAIYAPGVESSEQIGEGAIAITCNVVRSLCGADWSPTEVLLAGRPPADVRPYRRFFRSPVRFDAEQNALVFPAAVLEQRLPHANPELQRLLLEEVQQLDRELALDFTTKVRRLLRAGLIVGQCSAERTAALFAMQRRTLTRRLRAEGTTFEALLAEIRYEAARQLLTDTAMPMRRIAEALGYADLSVLTRAFKRWSGATPTEWRSALGAKALPIDPANPAAAADAE
jgi:AraC-like DNA-binding protein